MYENYDGVEFPYMSHVAPGCHRQVPALTLVGKGPKGDKGDKGNPGLDSRYDFENVSLMTQESDLEVGDICHTLGFHEAGDGGAAYYLITDEAEANGMDIIQLNNGLFAELQITESYVTPEMFGAYGDNVIDDTAYFYRMFEFVSDHAYNYNLNLGSLPIECNPKIYYFENTLTLPAQRNLIINGNNCTFRNCSITIDDFAYSILVNNVNFYQCDKSFEFTGETEFTNITFYKCRFNECTPALSIKRRSSMVKLDTCQFMSISDNVIYLSNVDNVVIDNCWFECDNSENTFNRDRSAIIQEGDDEGNLKIVNSFFIPIWQGSNNYWFDVSCKIDIDSCRISGESDRTILVKANSNISTYMDNSGKRSNILIQNCSTVFNVLVRLFGLPENISIINNTSTKYAGSKMIDWSETLTQAQQTALIKSKYERFTINIKSNNFREFDNYGQSISLPDSLLPSIPSNLTVFIKSGYRNQNYNSQIIEASKVNSGVVLDYATIKMVSNAESYGYGYVFMISYWGWIISGQAAEYNKFIIYLDNNSILKVRQIAGDSELKNFDVTANGITEGNTVDISNITFDNPLVYTIQAKPGRNIFDLKIMPIDDVDITQSGQM